MEVTDEIKCEFPPDYAEPVYEVSDILKKYLPAYTKNHLLLPSHKRILNALINCRTDALGAHVEHCDHCDHIEISYNSCRNRHCPKCQGSQRYQWVESRELELLPVQYFHVVFTLPDEILRLTRSNPNKCYDLLFKAAAETLQQFAKNHWDGQLGIIMALHTWGQTMNEHPHVHCIVTGGALKNDGSQFIQSPKNYLFPVKALSPVFRQKYIEGLSRLRKKEQLRLICADLKEEKNWLSYLQSLYQHDWVVYAKQPFDQPQHLLRYIGRYINRVAISNHRLISIEDGQIRFSYHDNRDDQEKIMTLPAEEFIRRFITHILPKGFRRLRYYGFMVNSLRKQKLKLCRALLSVPNPEQPYIPDIEAFLTRQGRDKELCPQCGIGTLHKVTNSLILWIYFMIKYSAPPDAEQQAA